MRTMMLHTRCVQQGLLLCCISFVGVNCGTESSARIDPALPSMNSREVGTAMSGNYSNDAQAKTNASFDSIELHLRPIWVDRIDGLWLYVEQSLTATPDKPYRQRVYQIVDGNDATSVETRIYEIPGDPLQYAGAWKKDKPLNALTAELLLPCAGCNITLRRNTADQSDQWIGSTQPNQCAAPAGGGMYSMSSVTLTQQEIQSWDRSYNAEGVQVAGSTSGPYIFRKTSR